MANRHELDRVSREMPISLDRIYRGIAVNTRVFELMGIDFDDPATHPDWFSSDPSDFEAGDIIYRDPDTGLPNGVFVGDRAPRLVARAIPEKSFEQRVESLVLGLEVLASLGITAVVEAGSVLGSVTEVYQAAYDSGRLPIRAVVYDGWYRSGDPQGLSDPMEIAARMESLGFSSSGDEWLRVRGAKLSADGGVGSRSAALSLPYLSIPDDPLGGENYGAFRDRDFDYRLAQFRALVDHDPSKILGRVKSGTLELVEDKRGLRVKINPPDTQVGRDIVESIRRGDVDQMSFAFVTREDKWESDEEGNTILRELLDVDLFDVSPVTFPAYPDTTVAVRSMGEFKRDLLVARMRHESAEVKNFVDQRK